MGLVALLTLNEFLFIYTKDQQVGLFRYLFRFGTKGLRFRDRSLWIGHLELFLGHRLT